MIKVIVINQRFKYYQPCSATYALCKIHNFVQTTYYVLFHEQVHAGVLITPRLLKYMIVKFSVENVSTINLTL